MVSAWRNFKNIFSRPLFTIIFRTKIVFFITYSILTGQTKVEFVIYWVLMNVFLYLSWKNSEFPRKLLLHESWKLCDPLWQLLIISRKFLLEVSLSANAKNLFKIVKVGFSSLSTIILSLRYIHECICISSSQCRI